MAKRKVNSRQKGARGERECAQDLRETFGVDARRGQQFCGTPDSPDVVADIPGVYWECKRIKDALNVTKALEQARKDAGGKMPVVWSRKDGKRAEFHCYFIDLPWIVEALHLALVAYEEM